MVEQISGWCMRCKCSKEMGEIELTKTSRGVDMARGKCLVCGCKMCKIGGIN